MTSETILTELFRINVVASAAIVAVLLLRTLAHRRFGARIAYWLWLIVPVAAVASFLPAPERIVTVQPAASIAAAEELIDPEEISPAADEPSSRVAPASSAALLEPADLLLVLWLLGAAALLARSIFSTRRLAADPSIGPALVGVLRPRLILPRDFESRFDAQERALILAHEQVHRSSRHPAVNALVEVARCASWFNPLVHLAANCIRADQELACDAAVIAARPAERRVYAQALLKTQIAPVFLPLGCTWPSRSAGRLKQRIAMLSRPPLRRRAAIGGAAVVAILGAASGYAAWAQQPERLVTEVARPEAVMTPAANAPDGALSHALEGQRHDLFIELAQKGDIDLVFFGTTSTEMWWWPRRGRSVWDRELGSLKAANFGSQGTHPDSLVWRMQNGELDGYQAKLFVLNVFGHPSQPPPARSRFTGWVDGYAAVIAEIRARQPQAKILLLAAFPRGGNVGEWREVATANAAAFASLVDDETVFYADFGERFFQPDGSFIADLWGGPAGVGAQAPLFELWADALQPWLDRFVR